ncbi:hypothetical protein CC1G_03370 [Coprinopsis cinerea okayama7|uniref:Uncharacterized protein n=1 Tax=Coprinopsis cinerea (strain Okayama-7 / 130 / ATCC MYA-4618 / FGSC 9003) TaxID=240176 RepID=A8NR00_COPC7|nr:hypothetical protein CC1G_03370 [Coprinopsis cinerea okayama7\|eukprot:XP_001835588.2 hypothetical protein CC1G_03370 [Coprinopsis cinerea okayama7\
MKFFYTLLLSLTLASKVLSQAYTEGDYILALRTLLAEYEELLEAREAELYDVRGLEYSNLFETRDLDLSDYSDALFKRGQTNRGGPAANGGKESSPEPNPEEVAQKIDFPTGLMTDSPVQCRAVGPKCNSIQCSKHCRPSGRLPPERPCTFDTNIKDRARNCQTACECEQKRWV